MLGGPFVLLAGLFGLLELTRPNRAPRAPGVPTTLLGLAWAAAATTHLTVIGEHFHESSLLGAFFLLLSLAQYAYALAVSFHSSQRLLLAGLAANLSVLLLWAYTRTIALPFGIGPRESVGAADLTATTCEVVAVVLTWIALRRAGAQLAPSPGHFGALTSTGATVGCSATGKPAPT